MDFSYLFEPYDQLITKADQAFYKMETEFGDCIMCRRQCSDCCHAVFGLFLIEAIFLKQDFDRLDEGIKQTALLRCTDADREQEKLEAMLKSFENDPQMQAYSLARARIRCPLLADTNECILYPYRPITCRVYGIPTVIQGRARACSKAKFLKDRTYPAFDLDRAHRELYQMSKEVLKSVEGAEPENASLLISVSKAIRTPVEELLRFSR